MVIAGGRPLTGESSISTPRWLQTSARRRISDGALVVVSDPRPASRQPGQYARLVVQHHPLGLNWPGQRCKHHARRLGNGPRALGPVGPHLAQIRRGLPAHVIHRYIVPGVQQAAGHGVPHSPGADVSNVHLLLRIAAVGFFFAAFSMSEREPHG